MSAPTIFIAGAGFMGHGIAQTAASAGCRVYLYELSPQLAAAGIERIRASLEKLKAKSPDAADPQAVLARITASTDLNDAASAEYVIEAIAEDASLKEALFSRLDEVSPDETLFLTNSSAIPISRLAATTRRPDRFCGMHFFGPVVLMKLVEVIRGIGTSDATVAKVTALARRFGKEPVAVNRDVAGFVVNRVLLAGMLEAMRLVEQNVASAADIDTAMKLGCGYKMGPLETADLSGLDIFLNAADAIYEDSGEAKFKAPALLRRLVAAGHLGRKSGHGFYTY